jgi:hypothetical protein
MDSKTPRAERHAERARTNAMMENVINDNECKDGCVRKTGAHCQRANRMGANKIRQKCKSVPYKCVGEKRVSRKRALRDAYEAPG